VFRHQWVLVRNERPMVPSPTKTPLPSKHCDSEEAARLLSVYLRPWVLSHRHASERVLHLSELDRVEVPRCRLRLRTKQKPPGHSSFYDAWCWYLDGHVVSEHAWDCIRKLLAMCLARGSKTRDRDNGSEGVGPIPPCLVLDCNLDLVHKVLGKIFTGVESEDTPAPNAKQPKSLAKTLRNRHWHAVRLGREMWQTAGLANDGVASIDASGGRATPDVQAFLKKALKKKSSESEEPMPFAGVNAPVAALYALLPRGGPCLLDQWLLDLHKSDEPPKEEQVAILRCVINRVKYERDAERLDLAEHRARQLRQP
jgi:hypothetical protein